MKHLKPSIRTTIFLLFLVFIQKANANTPYDQTDASIHKAILHHINQYRITHGLPMLTLDQRISEEATRHSREMAQHQIPFGHQKFEQRVARLYKTIKDATGAAENVAFNYKNADIVVKGWIQSPGHRHNIQGHYNLTGIGTARDKQGRIYYTQLFIRA